MLGLNSGCEIDVNCDDLLLISLMDKWPLLFRNRENIFISIFTVIR